MCMAVAVPSPVLSQLHCSVWGWGYLPLEQPSSVIPRGCIL